MLNGFVSLSMESQPERLTCLSRRRLNLLWNSSQAICERHESILNYTCRFIIDLCLAFGTMMLSVMKKPILVVTGSARERFDG